MCQGRCHHSDYAHQTLEHENSLLPNSPGTAYNSGYKNDEVGQWQNPSCQRGQPYFNTDNYNARWSMKQSVADLLNIIKQLSRKQPTTAVMNDEHLSRCEQTLDWR